MVSSSLLPSAYVPPAAAGLTEPESQAMAAAVEQAAVVTPLSAEPIPSTYGRRGQGGPPWVLLHGFDSSLLEFRRLLPRLAEHRETWAVDLLGFGFCDRTVSPTFSPAAIKVHLHSFWQQQIQQPMILVGASMGGAAALDFTLTYPEAVAQLVLLDSAGFAAGPNLERVMVPPFDRWATNFLANPWVRRRISLQAYWDRTLVTADADLCAALHLHCPRWAEALIAFTKTGGYNFLQDKIAAITRPTQILWGRQDKILGTQDAHRFVNTIPGSTLHWIDPCGHVPHLEQPAATAIQLITTAV